MTAGPFHETIALLMSCCCSIVLEQWAHSKAQHTSKTPLYTLQSSTLHNNNNNIMSNNLKDPRFLVIATLFTIYGLFIICIFLFSTGPMFWKGVCKGVVRRLCCLGESEESVESGVQAGGGVSERRDAEMRVRRRYVTHLYLFGGYLYTSYIVVYSNFYGCKHL